LAAIGVFMDLRTSCVLFDTVLQGRQVRGEKLKIEVMAG
jgi:hypothetical protein